MFSAEQMLTGSHIDINSAFISLHFTGIHDICTIILDVIILLLSMSGYNKLIISFRTLFLILNHSETLSHFRDRMKGNCILKA